MFVALTDAVTSKVIYLKACDISAVYWYSLKDMQTAIQVGKYFYQVEESPSVVHELVMEVFEESQGEMEVDYLVEVPLMLEEEEDE